MKKSASRIITIIFLCLMPVWMFASKDVKFSEKENRYMATFPKISAETVKNGSFMADRKSTRLNSSHDRQSRMPSSA